MRHPQPTDWAVEVGIRAVWVNGPSGECLGRFGRLGIDVHRRIEHQHLGECLDCTHGWTTLADWERFQRSMWDFHGIDISDVPVPEFVSK